MPVLDHILFHDARISRYPALCLITTLEWSKWMGIKALRTETRTPKAFPTTAS